MDINISNYLLQTINRCAHTELSSLQLVEIRKIANILGISTSTKRKDALIEEISRTLSAAMLRSPGSFSYMAGGFPVLNPDNEFGSKHPIFRKIIEKYNEMTGNPTPYGFNPQPQFTAHNPMMSLLGMVDPFQNLNPLAVPRVNQNPLLQLQLTKSKGNMPTCICGFPIYPDDKNSTVQCINADCSKVFHAACFKLKPGTDETKLFECHECTLKRCDPLHEVLEVLRAPFKLDNNKQEFMIDQNCFRRIQSDPNIGLEIRCIRIEEKSSETTWPHQGELYLNSKRELEFKPLLQNSSLKKRRDEKFFTRAVYPGMNSLYIKFIPRTANDFPKGKSSDMSDTYIAAIYVVQKLTCDELIARIKQNNVRKVEDCKELVRDQLKGGDIEIDRVNYPLTCVLDMQILKTPAKGAHCRHVNCFSLENFVMVWFKNNQRKWLCPICKTKAYDIVVDSYFQGILKDAKEKGILENENAEVTIDQNAEYFFNTNEKETKNNKVQDNEKMVSEQTTDLKSEVSKNSVLAGKGTTTSKKARDETSKTPNAIVLDSDEELQPSKSANSKNPHQSELLNLAVQNSLGASSVNKNESSTKPHFFEETKSQRSSEGKFPKQINKPDFSNVTLQQNLDPSLAALKGDINVLANLTNPINPGLLSRGLGNESAIKLTSPQLQGLSGLGSNGQMLNQLNPLGMVGRNWMQGQGSDSASMEVEMQDGYQTALKRQLLMQQAGLQMNNPNMLESLAGGLYPGMLNYSKPTLQTPGFGLGSVGSNDLILNLLQSNILQQQQQQQQLQQQIQQQLLQQLQQQQLQQQQIQYQQALLLMQQQQQQQQQQAQQQTPQQTPLIQQSPSQQPQMQSLAQEKSQVQSKNDPKSESKAQPEKSQQPNPQHAMETELPPLQKERKELYSSIFTKPDNLLNLISTTKDSLSDLMKEADKDGDLLTFEMFSGNKSRKKKKAEKRAITTKKKLLSSVYKYLDDDVKQTIATKGDITIRRKKKQKPAVGETDKENGLDDKMQIEAQGEQSGQLNGASESAEKNKSKAQKAKKSKNKSGEVPKQKESVKSGQQELSNEPSRDQKQKGQVTDPICLDD